MIACLAAALLLGGQAFSLFMQERAIEKRVEDLRGRIERAETDRRELTAELEYFGNPANLEKELRARFNYKKPGETMIVIVPNQTSSPTGTAP